MNWQLVCICSGFLLQFTFVAYGEDCNVNGIPDECDLSCAAPGCSAPCGTSQDCNSNAIPDECDITSGTSQDCQNDGQGNGIPDECESDCNCNDVRDECDISCATEGCFPEYLPPVCGQSEDCNTNDIPDECDIDDETSQDCNYNGLPDECDITSGLSEDCQNDDQGNGIPDECENDCNCNGVRDECDISCNEPGCSPSCGTSEDCDDNQIPDECYCSADVVIVMDTSGSMVNQLHFPLESIVFCTALVDALDALEESGINLRTTLLVIADDPDPDPEEIPICYSIADRFRLNTYLGTTEVPGADPGDCGVHLLEKPLDIPYIEEPIPEFSEENWAPSTAAVAEYFDWQPGAARIIVPMSDAGPCFGQPCSRIEDVGAIDNAIAVAQSNLARVCPVTGMPVAGELGCIEADAARLAISTGGQAVTLSDYYDDVELTVAQDAFNEAVFDALESTIRSACSDCCVVANEAGEDCNANGIPDVCEPAPERLFVTVLHDDPADNPTPVPFSVPYGTPYKLTYDVSHIELFEADDTLIVSGAVRTDADPGSGCVDLPEFLDFQNCFTGKDAGQLPPGCQALGFDSDEDLDIDLNDMAGLIFCGPAVVFVGGVTVSPALNDTFITLDVQLPGQPGVFEEQAVQPVTVASVTVSPTSGGLGTPITIDLAPADYPLAFDCLSTLAWEGVYDPLIGEPTDLFKTSYNEDQVCGISSGSAKIHAGDGTVTNFPNVAGLEGLGSLDGSLTIELPGATLNRLFEFTLETTVAELASIAYIGNGPIPAPPTLGDPVNAVRLMELSRTSDPLNPDQDILLSSRYFHYAVVMRAQSTGSTSPVYSGPAPAGSVDFMVPGNRADPGAHWVADDIKLTTPGGCQAVGYEIAVHGGGGSDFDVHVELFDFYGTLFDYPGTIPWLCHENLPINIEGTGIPGTAMDFTGVSGSGVSYLYIPLEVALPEEMWVYASFSTDQAGWVIADGIDVGSEVIENPESWDCFGGNPDNGYACQICFNFDTEEGDPLAAMATQVYCYDGEPEACKTPPSALLVDLITYDAAGVETGRVENVQLVQAPGDNDPQNVLYHTRLYTPVIFVDVPFIGGDYPNVILVHTEAGGTTAIVAATD